MSHFQEGLFITLYSHEASKTSYLIKEPPRLSQDL